MAAPFNPPLTEAEVSGAFPSLEVQAAVKAGGQGATFRCKRAGSSAPVALKIYSPGAGSERERVQREIKKLKAVASPYVMKHEGDGEVTLRGDLCPFLLAEWIDGVDLRTHTGNPVTGATPFAEGEVLQLVGQGAQAVAALSAVSVVHRDINPNNVMRRKDGRFVLIDLGFAKHLDMDTITERGAIVGTWGYISPELFSGRYRPTFRSDLFSLGIVAYEMAAGVHPFGRDQRRAGRFEFNPLPNLTETTNQLLRRLMSSQPLDRARTREEIPLACGY